MNFSPINQIPIVESQFPTSINISNKSITRHILYNDPKHPLSEYTPFINLMDETISQHYLKNDGINWKKNKNLEMQENGLIYIYYTLDEDDNKNNDHKQIVAFISFLLTLDDDELVLYLYEIHVSPNFKNLGIGKTLIHNFHGLISNYRQNLSIPEIDIKELQGSKLTVFSDNITLKWYENLGYVPSSESPVDRTLRSGKVLKPDYYILIREFQ